MFFVCLAWFSSLIQPAKSPAYDDRELSEESLTSFLSHFAMYREVFLHWEQGQ